MATEVLRSSERGHVIPTFSKSVLRTTGPLLGLECTSEAVGSMGATMMSVA